MQYAKLPKTLCDHLERLQRGFIWGDSEQGRKTQLVGWNVCCLPKTKGGLGLKNPRLMNDAFLLKILWGLVRNPEDLRCQVLYGKYKHDHDIKVSIEAQRGDSPLWKALVSLWPQFQDNFSVASRRW